MLMYSALGTPPFRNIRLRARRRTCPACGEDGERAGSVEETDYVAFCGGARPDWVARGLEGATQDGRIGAKVGLVSRVCDSWVGSYVAV